MFLLLLHSGHKYFISVTGQKNGDFFFSILEYCFATGCGNPPGPYIGSHFFTHNSLLGICLYLLVSRPPHHSCPSCLENMTLAPESVQDQGLASCCVPHYTVAAPFWTLTAPDVPALLKTDFHHTPCTVYLLVL